MTLYKSNPRTSSINGFLKQSGEMMANLVNENDKLWEANVKLSDVNDSLREELEMNKVGHEMARSGRLQYRQIPNWVTQKMSGGKTASYYRQVLSETQDLSPADFSPDGSGLKKKSSAGVTALPEPLGPSPISRTTARTWERLQEI